MDIEQLKLILDVVSSAGEGAYTIALIWALTGVVIPLVWAAVVVELILAICRLVKHNIDGNSLSVAVMDVCRLEYMPPGERDAILDCIRKHYGRD